MTLVLQKFSQLQMPHYGIGEDHARLRNPTVFSSHLDPEYRGSMFPKRTALFCMAQDPKQYQCTFLMSQ
jgi:hypothetical protein